MFFDDTGLYVLINTRFTGKLYVCLMSGLA